MELALMRRHRRHHPAPEDGSVSLEAFGEGFNVAGLITKVGHHLLLQQERLDVRTRMSQDFHVSVDAIERIVRLQRQLLENYDKCDALHCHMSSSSPFGQPCTSSQPGSLPPQGRQGPAEAAARLLIHEDIALHPGPRECRRYL